MQPRCGEGNVGVRMQRQRQQEEEVIKYDHILVLERIERIWCVYGSLSPIVDFNMMAMVASMAAARG